jgi:hypothetical protein
VDVGGCPAEKNDYHGFVDLVVGNVPALEVVAEETIAGGLCNRHERIVVVAAAGIHEADLAVGIDNAVVVARGVVAPAEAVRCYSHEKEKDFEVETVFSG